MKTHKNGLIALAIALIVLCVVAFAIPTEKTAVFFIALVFTFIAFATQPVLWHAAAGGRDRYAGIPPVYIGIVYLLVQCVAFAVFLFATTLPAWSAIVTCVLIAGLFALFALGTLSGRNHIDRVQENIQEKVFYLRALQSDVEVLALRQADPALRASLDHIAQLLRYSDPMSHVSLAPLEDDIRAKIGLLADAPDIGKAIDEIVLLLDERNRKCRILK